MIRKLSFEAMEARRLLAADLQTDSETDFHVAGNVSANAFAEIGNLDGSALIRSQLGWYNMYDRIGFSVQREANVSVQLDGLWADADLYLTDAFGRVLDFSSLRGTAGESIETRVDAGTYYVWSVARTYSWTPYHMELTAQQIPEPLPEPAPTPAPGDSGGDVSPLPEVAYYGSAYDWGLNEIGAPESWASGFRGQGVTVAVIDTGVDLDHPDLVENLYVNTGEIAGNGIDDDGNGYIDDLHGFDFADNDSDPDDVHGHGTHVAGTIAAVENGFGATGVAPDATILPVKVLGDNGSGTSTSVAAGIRYAADQGADIINLSLGGGFSYDIEMAIDYARSLGSLIVAASGNEYASMPGFPARFSASYDNVLSVGAYDSSGNIAAFSNDVGASGAVQLDAPGVAVFSTYVGGRYASMSGTSMATPHVAGLAALTLSSNRSLSPSQLRDLLVAGAVSAINGSDAIGKASALYSVAYAAAGESVDSSSGGGSTSSSSSSSSVSASTFSNHTSSLVHSSSSTSITDDQDNRVAVNEVRFVTTKDSKEVSDHQGHATDIVFSGDCEFLDDESDSPWDEATTDLALLATV